MKNSEYTSKQVSKLWILRTIEFILLVCPLLVYVFIAFFNEKALVIEKVTLAGTVSIAGILTILNALFKKHLRSPIWIIVIGLYVALQNIMPLIIILAVSTVVDEFFIAPAIEKQKVKVITNKEIDRRGN